MKEKVLDITGRFGKATIKYTVKEVVKTAKIVYDHREEISSVGLGVAKGVGDVVLNLYGTTKTDEVFAKQISRIKEQCVEFEQLESKKAYNKLNKDTLLESVGISASFLGSYFGTYNIPNDVYKAYEMAYPVLSKEKSLEELIKNMDSEQIQGLVSGIKGKLFEIKYVDFLNSEGHLPDGYEAIMAQSATNPGWDIQIVGEDGSVVNELQLKATESLQYVNQALERYPDIDVVTTEEVYSEIAMHGMAENVINSGISNQEITELVESSITDAPLEMHWGPPVVPLLIIGYSLYKCQNCSLNDKLEEGSNRYVKSYLAYLVGGAVTTFTGLWFAGLIAAIGSRILLSKGKIRYEKYKSLQDVIDNNDIVLKRMQKTLA